MRRTARVLISLVMVALIGVGSVSADERSAPSNPSSSSSSKGRWIGLAIGAAGGFAAGVWLGLSHFDEAINSDRKVWSLALAGGAAGGLGGFLLGRSIDRRGPTPVVNRQLALPATMPMPSKALMAPPCSVRLGCSD